MGFPVAAHFSVSQVSYLKSPCEFQSTYLRASHLPKASPMEMQLFFCWNEFYFVFIPVNPKVMRNLPATTSAQRWNLSERRERKKDCLAVLHSIWISELWFSISNSNKEDTGESLYHFIFLSYGFTLDFQIQIPDIVETKECQDSVSSLCHSFLFTTSIFLLQTLHLSHPWTFSSIPFCLLPLWEHGVTKAGEATGIRGKQCMLLARKTHQANADHLWCPCFRKPLAYSPSM